MSKLRKVGMWALMLNKRLYRTPSFIIILLVVAALTLGLKLFASDDSSVMRISIYAQGKETVEFFEDMAKEKSVISYTFYDSEEEALSAVKKNGYDAAWIFEKDLKSSVRDFVKSGIPVVKVTQREDTVFLRIAREKLFATLYPKIAREVHADFMDDNFGVTNEKVLDKYYRDELSADDIVEIKFNNSNDSVDSLNHIIGPVRGILAVAIFLCAYAALLTFKKDRNNGMFGRIAMDKHIYIEIMSILIVTLNISVITLISLKIAGLFGNFGIEILYMLLYAVMCTAFCVLFGEIVDSISVIGTLLPSIAMITLVVCPVFINIKQLPYLQIIFPTFYYLSAFRNAEYMLRGILYIAIVILLCIGIRQVKKRRY